MCVAANTRMTADGLRSHLIVAFLDLYEIARLQVAFSNLDRDLRDPDSRCELMASSPGLERATVASAQTLEHLAIASRPRLTFSFQPGTHPEEDLILITNPAPSASARLSEAASSSMRCGAPPAPQVTERTVKME